MISDEQVAAFCKAFHEAPEFATFKEKVLDALEAADAAAWSTDITKAPTDGTKFLLLFLGETIIASWSHVFSSEVRELVGHNVKWFDGQTSVTSIKDGLGRLPEGLLWRPLPTPPKEPTE